MSSFYDSFARADSNTSIGTSDSGHAWTNISGVMGISGRQACPISGAISIATVDLGFADAVIRWTVAVGSAPTAMIFRLADANNYFYMYAFNLAKIVAGVFSVVHAGGMDETAGKTHAMVCSGSSFTYYIEGVQQWTVSDAFNQTATKFGVRSTDTISRWSRLAAQPSPVATAEWHVTPTGDWFGDGSSARPWDFRTAMTYTPGIVRPDDTVTVHAGAHGTSGDPMVFPCIGGTAGHPIIVRRAPGEGWPRIYVGLNARQTDPGYVANKLIDFTQSNYNRYTNYKNVNPTYFNGGVTLSSPFTEFHYCLNRNNNNAWFYAEQALGSIVHMCLTYYNGFRDVTNGLPAVQGFYRQVDDAGTGLFQYLDTSITCLNYQSGMQMYGSGASKLSHGRTDKCLFFYGGYLGSTYSAGQGVREILIGSTSTFVHVDQCYFDQVWLWPQPTAGDAYNLAEAGAIQLGYNGQDNTFVSVTNSQILGRVDTQYFRNLEFYKNTVAQPGFNKYVHRIEWTAVIGVQPVQAGSGIDFNTFYQSNDGIGGHSPWPLIENDGVSNHNYFLHAPPDWTVATGYDTNSTMQLFGTQPNAVGVYPNTYEPAGVWPTPRAFIYVFNYQNLSSVQADVSACLTPGEGYALYDWGVYEQDAPAPLLSGTYGGGSITIPMKVQLLPELIADAGGLQSLHADLPIIPPGQPGAYILCKTDITQPTFTGVTVPIVGGGTTVAFHPDTAFDYGLRQGDRYYIAHGSDLTPEKFGRQAIADGVWQGGHIWADVSSAYPNATGPFYVIKTGNDGTGKTGILREFLNADAKKRAL